MPRLLPTAEKPARFRGLAAAGLATLLLGATPGWAATRIEGVVEAGTSPVAGARLTLWAASAEAPARLAEVSTNAEGRFSLALEVTPPGASLYLTATGGSAAADRTGTPHAALGLMSVLGATPPARVVVNEFTTLASVWTHAQFIEGGAIRGPALGLRIAAGNVPAFVDRETGGYGGTIQDALNSAQTPTMANFATLASIIAGCTARVAPDACTRLFAATTPEGGTAPSNTLAAAEAIAKRPAWRADAIFALLDAFYPVPQGRPLRATPYMPYLSFVPSAWTFPLKYTGGGYSGGGKLAFDAEGNVWVGNNFIVGAQNESTLWAGNLTQFAPDGRPLSPMTFGYRGGGLSGVGFGLAIDAQGTIWPDSYAARAITRFDAHGRPLSPPEGWTFDGRLGEMQGIISTPSGDIWALDQGRSQLVHLPGGDPARGRVLCTNPERNPLANPCHLVAPFHLAIDQQDRVWVTNNIGNHVTRFHVSDPTRVETLSVGYSGSGLAIDSQGNVWVANRLGSSARGAARLAEMLVAFTTMGELAATRVLVHRLAAQTPAYWEGGSVSVLRPDGTQAAFSPVTGRGLAGPWAIAVDGRDNVWISNLVSPATGIVHLCGFRTENCPPGMQTGDAISPPGGYVGGGMQLLVDVGVGPAGDVWVTNNWQNYDAALGRVPEALSTQGAGQGVVVFHGMAAPVRTPLIGVSRQP